MEVGGSKHLTDCTDETVLTTPQPRASSTIHKRQLVKKINRNQIPFTYSPDMSNSSTTSKFSINSLGFLNLDNLTHLRQNSSQSHEAQTAIEKWQEQRALGNSILEKSKGLDLPSRYLRPSDTCKNSTDLVCSDSSVNETDLLEQEQLSFNPDDISTPRSSVSGLSGRRSTINKHRSISKGIAELSQKMRSSDVNLVELCNQYSLSFNTDNARAIDYNEESFIPGELAGKKFEDQENSWKRELNPLGGRSIHGDSIFSQFSLQDSSISISEFFRKKSELADLCLKKSPEKVETLVPLIDNSVSFETSDASNLSSYETSESALGITELEKALSFSDNTAKVAELIGMTTKKRSRNTKENLKQSLMKESLRPLKTSDNSFKVEPLKDSRNITRETEYHDNTNSIHTASSLDSLPGGKLPIETNRIELVWGCVRAGKKTLQNFILRNKSQNKLRLQISSSSTCFRILSDHSELDSVSILPIVMYPSESRSFTIAFSPTVVGAVVGKLNFTPVSSELQLQQQKRQVLMMYGYGGHANMEVENVSKDSNMKMWLSLGKLNNEPQLIQKFDLQNIGNISAFSCLKFSSKALYESSKLLIYPTEIVLHPREKTTVTLTYTPTKEDAKHLFTLSSNHVMELGCIQIISGPEVLRGRIRRLCGKLKQENGTVGNKLIEQLSKKFPNEKMPKDLNCFTETVGSVKELMQNFDSKEITITLEKDSERTLVGQIGGIDGSSMFQSLCEYMTTIVDGKAQLSSCSVEPTSVLLTPPTKTSDAILVISNSNVPLQFQTKIEPFGIEVAPSEGILSPGETTLIRVSCNIKKLRDHRYFKLSVYVDDDVYDVDIKVIFLKTIK